MIHNKYLFPLFDEVEPEHLFGFHKEYLNQLPELKAMIAAKFRKQTEICVKRIQPNGSVKHKIFRGFIESFSEKGFNLLTNETWNCIHDDLQTIFFRFDNILADVPVLSFETPIFDFRSKSKAKKYMLWLEDIKKELEKLIGTDHNVILNYKYSKTKPLFRDGHYHVISKITEVNKSNLKFDHFKTMAYINNEQSYIDLVPRENEIDRFIAGDRYLSSITIRNENYQINYHDC